MKLFEIAQSKMSPKEAFEYSEIHGCAPELEDIIATDAGYSYAYAHDILHDKRFPAGEKVIATSALNACLYAVNVLNNRFPDAEKMILKEKNPLLVLYYAKNVLGRRWLKAETIIRKNKHWWNDYKYYFNIK